MTKTITIQELNDIVEVLIKDSTGQSHYIQNYDDWVLEDDAGNITIDPLPELVTVVNNRVIINGAEYRPYTYKEVVFSNDNT